ncbi:hypothetical protein KY309_01990 [Candidatus Woesearchaeota archaeon]|nr:hypothetical protein [Candidatus Woesearchaeota archaeon]MBW3016358.1 hypothetical protein [Candidatus Woesearchaeota archaeon]
MGIQQTIFYILNKIPQDAIENFRKAANDWEQLNANERELLQQEEQSFKAYLRAHSIYSTHNSAANWSETEAAKSIRERKEPYLKLAEALKEIIENNDRIRKLFRLGDTLEKLTEARQHIEALLVSEDSARYHFRNDKAAEKLIPELRERYQQLFVPISHEALLRRDAGTIFPIYYVRPTEGNLTRIFYIHIGGTETALQEHITDQLVKLARTRKIQQTGDFVLVQSNMSKAPTQIEQNKILKSLGFKPEVISI